MNSYIAYFVEDLFSLVSILFCLDYYCFYWAWGGGGEEGGGGENAVGCLVCSFCPKDLLNLICLKYVFFFLICYLVVLLDSVIYCSL
jgi:hypothetical protein